VTGLDTNILLRYFTQDDPDQSPKAAVLIERRLTASKPGFISLVAIAELAWTLKSRYRRPPDEIAELLARLISAPNLVVQNANEVAMAIDALQTGGSFADSLIVALSQWSGCETTWTFDRKASSQKGFRILLG
jgi:predicted nucleic-acid-binding protein